MMKNTLSIIVVLLVMIQELLCGCKQTNNATITCETIADFEKEVWIPAEVIIESKDLENVPKTSRQFSKFCGVYSISIINQLSEIIPKEKLSYLCRLKFVNLYHNDIKRLYEKSFPNQCDIYVMNLSNNGIESIDRHTFGRCQPEVINLSYNKIDIIETATFTAPSGMNKTKTLFLNNNRLATIEKHTFPSSLEHLFLMNNDLSFLEDKVFENLSNLTVLNLSHNKISTIPNIFSLRTTFHLDMSYNRLIRVTDETFSNKNYKFYQVQLNHNRISYITNNIYAYGTVFLQLDLSYNKLENVDFLNIANKNFKIGMVNLAFNLLSNRNFINNINHAWSGLTLILYGNPWLCSEWIFIERKLLTNKIRRVDCDEEFFNNGQQPFCVCSAGNCNYFPETPVKTSLKARRSDKKNFIEIARKKFEMKLCYFPKSIYYVE